MLQQVAGRLTGNRRLEARGTVEKMAGTVQNSLGKAQDQMVAALRRR
jgi:uncharacterized protein YjbJ (UPF0337 family)